MRHQTLLFLACIVFSLSAGAGGDKAHMNATQSPVYLTITGCENIGWERAVSAAAYALSRGGVPSKWHDRALCGTGVPRDAPHCLRDVLISLQTTGGVELCAVVGADGAGCLTPWLKDMGLWELGDAGAPIRRSCLASPSAANLRALADLADAQLAKSYELHEDDQNIVFREAELMKDKICEDCIKGVYSPEQCNSGACGVMLVGDAGELAVARDLVRAGGLRVRIAAVGLALPHLLAQIKGPTLACGWHDELAPLYRRNATTLDPPPCTVTGNNTCDPGEPPSNEACPFESRRIVKLAVRQTLLQRASTLERVLDRFGLSQEQLSALEAEGETGAMQKQLAQEWAASKPPESVRVAALVPATGGAGVGLAAAAELAALDVGDVLHVHSRDSQCSPERAMRLVADEVGWGGFGELSALAGPACAAALQQARAWSTIFGLPVLAYTPAARGEAAATGAALLAGGTVRARWAAIGALLARYNWRRVAVLSEAALRPETSLPGAELILNKELSDDNDIIDEKSIKQWVKDAAELDVRILVVAAENAHVVETALCAARGVGLARGAVWLLPRYLALRSANHSCLLGATVLAVTSEWAHAWRTSHDASTWRNRWRIACLHWIPRVHGASKADCQAPGASAALLYDTLRLWGRALTRLRSERPEAFDELHDPAVVQSLINYATETADNATTLTGNFEWEGLESVRTRREALVVTQWRDRKEQRVARWSAGGDTDALQVEREPHWATADGSAPLDAAAHCALSSLASSLGGDCDIAWAVLLAAVLAVAVAVFVGLALFIRRKLELRYQARMHELTLRPLLAEPPAPGGWEIPRSRVVITHTLGIGAFGKVYGGYALLSTGGALTAVAVKTLQPGASQRMKVDFLAEAETMKRFNHKNIVKLLGGVTANAPVWTVMELLRNGDLRQYLLARHDLALGAADAADTEEVSPRWLTSVALDAACALSYLAEERYAHCDVAARNCLLTGGRRLKLADFGMTRAVFDQEYVQLNRDGRLPVRWMSPESLARRVFSPASDIWSFGLLLYEIVTFGSLPYRGRSNFEAMSHVLDGGVSDIPAGIKPPLEGLMKLCWHFKPEQRPEAHEVVTYLADAPELLSPSREALLSPWYGSGGGSGAGEDVGGSDTDVTYLSESQVDINEYKRRYSSSRRKLIDATTT